MDGNQIYPNQDTPLTRYQGPEDGAREEIERVPTEKQESVPKTLEHLAEANFSSNGYVSNYGNVQDTSSALGEGQRMRHVSPEEEKQPRSIELEKGQTAPFAVPNSNGSWRQTAQQEYRQQNVASPPYYSVPPQPGYQYPLQTNGQMAASNPFQIPYPPSNSYDPYGPMVEGQQPYNYYGVPPAQNGYPMSQPMSAQYHHGYVPQVKPKLPESPKKRFLRHTGTKLGIGLLFNFLLNYGIAFLFYMVVAMVPYRMRLTWNQEMVIWIVQLITTLGVGIGTVLMMRWLLKIKVKSFFGRAHKGIRYTLGGFPVGLSFNVFATFIITMISYMLLMVFQEELASPDFSLSGVDNPVLMGIYFVCLCIAAPILEEIIFRGYVLRSLQNYGNVFAILVSSILFGLYHGNLFQALPTAAFGIVLAYVAIRSNSLIPSICIHALNNLVASLNVLLLPFMDGEMASFLSGVVIWGIILIGLLILVITGVTGKLSIRNNNRSGLGNGNCVKTLVSSPGMIVCLVIFALQIGLNFYQ